MISGDAVPKPRPDQVDGGIAKNSGDAKKPVHDACRLYVSSIAYSTQGWKLRQHFERAGPVTWAHIFSDNKNGGWKRGKSLGRGYVEFDSPATTEVALATLNGVELDGRALQLDQWTSGWKSPPMRWVLPPLRKIAEIARSTTTASELMAAMRINDCVSDLADIRCLENAIDAFGKDQFWSTLLPFICEEALRIADAYEAKPPPILGARVRSISFTRRDCVGVLANSLLCAWPGRQSLHVGCGAPAEDLPTINMDKLISATAAAQSKWPAEQCQKAKLEILLLYFQRQRERLLHDSLPAGDIKLILNQPGNVDWSGSEKPLAPFHVKPLRQGIDSAEGALRGDFAARFYGGGVLKNGAVQEEILFATHPELIVGRLVLPEMTVQQAIVMNGAEHMGKTTGYGSSLTFDGAVGTPQEFAGAPSESAERPWWTAFDAADYSKTDPVSQARTQNVKRDLNKAWAAFSLPTKLGAPKAIATGNWGAGAFKGDAQLKALIQWVAASRAGLETIYYPFDNERLLTELPRVTRAALDKGVSISTLAKWLLQGGVQTSNIEKDVFTQMDEHFELHLY